MSQNNTPRYPCEPCGLQTFERNRYFDGKLLVTRDFQGEQAYLRGKDRLHNSLLHGYGTVCGLEVEQHPNPAIACRQKYVVLNPGLALDCCGNEIVVPERQIINCLELIEQALKEKDPKSNLKSLAKETDEQRKRRIIHLRLAYQECNREEVPVLLDDCSCNETNTEYNRTSEGYRLFAEVITKTSEEESPEPIDARLQWQHTLSVAEPKAMVTDRQLKRLYVAEYIGEGEHGGGWLRTYDTDTHRLISRLPIGSNRRPTAAARSNFGEKVYVADYGSVFPYGYGSGEALAIGGELLEPESELSEATTGDEFPVRIRIFKQTDLEKATDKDVTAVVLDVPGTSPVVRLETSNGDNSLYALTQEGHLFHWSAAEIDRKIAEPTATVTYTEHNLRTRLGQLLSLPEDISLNLVDMSQSPDGQWLVIADTEEPRLIVVLVPQFDALAPISEPSSDQLKNLLQVFSLPEGEYPAALTINYQGNALYLLCTSIEEDAFRDEDFKLPADNITKKLYRLIIQDRPELSTYLPQVPAEGDLVSVIELKDEEGAIATSIPIDLEVSPRDNWVYVQRRLFNLSGENGPLDRNDVLIVSVKDMELHQIKGQVDTAGDARFQNLAFLGQRLYVAGRSPNDSTDGSISILYVDETTCDNFIRQDVENGCITCDDPSQGLILATIEGYRLYEPFVNPRINDTDNLIDNFKYRPMVPSTNTIKQVIQCMLKKGISEGIPGPPGQRGPKGEPGAGITDARAQTLEAGVNATASLEDDLDGDQRLVVGIPRGEPGAGITDARAQTLGPGVTATAALEDDPDGDQRLVVGIPRGEPGAGITDARAQTLEPGVNATAALEDDPDGDQRLVVGIPRGEPGQIQPGQFNQVINASWHHDEVLNRNDERWQTLFEEGEEPPLGLVIQFKESVLTQTLHERSAFILVQRLDNQGFLCECRIAATVEPVEVTEAVDTEVNWLIQYVLTPDSFKLISEVTPIGDGVTQAVRLTPLVGWQKFLSFIQELSIVQFKVVLRGDWILDEQNRGLDGNHLWPGVPEGATAAIGADGQPIQGRLSGDGTEGGDWISTIHIQWEE